MDEKENDKEQIGFWVPPEITKKFYSMCDEDIRKPSKQFEWIIINEWARRHPQSVIEQEQDNGKSLKPPTNPLKRKQSSN